MNCRHCKTEQDELKADIRKEYIANGGFHLMAYCYLCGKFIKNIPHAKPQVLFFGKHKGKSISQIAEEDASYLRWLSNQNIKESLKCAILSELEKKNANRSEPLL
jgi:hypothetical protein